MRAAPRHQRTLPQDGWRVVVRRVVSALSAGVLVGAAFVGTAAGSITGAPGPAVPDLAAVIAAAGSAPDSTGFSIGRVGGSASSTPQTLDQILALLERAEHAAHEKGRQVTPAISQAAAELGVLLTSYLAQNDDGVDGGEALADVPTTVVSPPAPVAPRSTAEPTTDPASAVIATTASRDLTTDAPTSDDPASASGDQNPVDDPASRADGATGDQAGAGEGSDALADEPVLDLADEWSEVTFDDVVLAAMRLATLLDSEGVYEVAVDGPSGPQLADEDTPLTTMLREAVERYGGSTDGYANGRIPADVLCELPFAPGHRLRCDAAAQLVALNVAYEARFGRPIPMNDSYRPIERQVALKATKPHLAATPGRSLHGWGLAVDLGAPISGGTSDEYLWLRLNGPDYGWDNPSWARLNGSKPEPWHFEFFAAGPVPNRALSPEDVALFRAATAAPGKTPAATSTPAPTAPPSDSNPTPDPAPTPSAPASTSKPTPTSKPSPTPKATPTTKPSSTTKPSPTPKASPTTKPSSTPKATPTPTAAPKPQPSASPSPSHSRTPKPSQSETPTPNPTSTSSQNPTSAPTDDPATTGPEAPAARDLAVAPTSSKTSSTETPDPDPDPTP